VTVGRSHNKRSFAFFFTQGISLSTDYSLEYYQLNDAAAIHDGHSMFKLAIKSSCAEKYQSVKRLD
jgi:hypothetical protein